MSHKYILLIEDNPDDEKLAVIALREGRIANEITVLRDGAEAVDFLWCHGKFAGRDPAHLPQVVLMDLKLPKISGLDLLRRIRADATLKRLPVVVLTSSREQQDIVDSYGLGANSYVQKPVEFTEFRRAVAQLGLYWMVINQSPVDLGGA